MIEKFDPTDPKYKKVKDLPVEKQPHFSDVDGGFVGKGALQEYSDAEKSVMKAHPERITMPPQELVLNELENYAKSEENRETEAGNEVPTQLKNGFDRIFEKAGSELVDAIDNHKFDSVISEDKNGRIPAEAMLGAINQIYRSRGEPEAQLVPLSLSRFPRYSDVYSDPVTRRIEQALRNNLFGKGFLYVTEIIDSGKTVFRMKEAFDYAFRNKSLQKPKYYAFMTLASHLDGWETNIAEPFKQNGQVLFSVNGETSLGYDDVLGRYSGLDDGNATSKKRLKEIGQIILEETSNHIVGLYNKTKQSNK